MKSIYVCAVAFAVTLTQAAAAQEAPKGAPGEHALAVRDGKIVHVRKDQGSAAPRAPAEETVTTKQASARAGAPGEHVMAVRNGRIVHIPKRHLAP